MFRLSAFNNMHQEESEYHVLQKSILIKFIFFFEKV